MNTVQRSVSSFATQQRTCQRLSLEDELPVFSGSAEGSL